MSYPDEATSESTIGAILLLAGVEVSKPCSLDLPRCLELGRTDELLSGSPWDDVSGSTSYRGSAAAASALSKKGHISYWRNQAGHILVSKPALLLWPALILANRQDLNSSILAGSRRIVDHTTFVELQWIRDPFAPNFFRLPPGFQRRSYLFTSEFIEVLEDIHALQCIREVPRLTNGDVMLMAHINNHTASIQSRLVGLPNLSPILECCRLAAYICSVMLCCKVWCALVIPVGESQTLRSLSLTSLARVKEPLVHMDLTSTRFLYQSDSGLC